MAVRARNRVHKAADWLAKYGYGTKVELTTPEARRPSLWFRPSAAAHDHRTIDIGCIKKFENLFNEDCRKILVHGGRGSGKSQHVALTPVLASPEEGHILCTREIHKVTADSPDKLLASGAQSFVKRPRPLPPIQDLDAAQAAE